VKDGVQGRRLRSRNGGRRRSASRSTRQVHVLLHRPRPRAGRDEGTAYR
jgi:hypothetical protein